MTAVPLFPVTPGGLGIVEASLSGLLILAGVRPGYAVLATLAYRMASYWLPLLAGLLAYLLFRHRYGRPAPGAPRRAGSANRQRAAKRGDRRPVREARLLAIAPVNVARAGVARSRSAPVGRCPAGRWDP
jgi:lysylphosphatidylglycerol synthase-like protein